MPRYAGSGSLVLAVMLLAGCGQGGSRESAGVPSLASADPSMVGEQRLPDGHPPVSPSNPRLPQGHPVLPEGHPLLEGQGKVGCPGRAQREGWGRGTAPVPAAAPEIVST